MQDPAEYSLSRAQAILSYMPGFTLFSHVRTIANEGEYDEAAFLGGWMNDLWWSKVVDLHRQSRSVVQSYSLLYMLI